MLAFWQLLCETLNSKPSPTVAQKKQLPFFGLQQKHYLSSNIPIATSQFEATWGSLPPFPGRSKKMFYFFKKICFKFKNVLDLHCV
jgi:hypothetical protein